MVVELVSTGAISTVFESPPGNVLNTRAFVPGQNLRIGAHVVTSQYLANPFAPITFEVIGITDPIFIETRTNWLGDAWVDVVLPYENTKANVKITAYFMGGPPAIEIVPIAIGEYITPEGERKPIVPDPLPEPEKAPDIPIINPINNTVKWVMIGVGVIALLYVASKAAPSISRGYSETRRSIR